MLPTDGVFIYIGNIPNTEIFIGKLELNQWGFIVADGRQQTSVPGVFAAGDVLADMATQQVAVATGTGTIAAIEAERYLTEQQ